MLYEQQRKDNLVRKLETFSIETVDQLDAFLDAVTAIYKNADDEYKSKELSDAIDDFVYWWEHSL